MDTLISVVVPTYNSASFISDTIDSILNQSYTSIELIVVDDASKDNTVDVVRSYSDSRIKLISLKENHHVCTACNKAFEEIKGKYTAFCGHDDIWHEDKLEKQINFLEQNREYAICFSWASIIDEKKKNISDLEPTLHTLFHQANRTREEWISKLVLQGNCLCAPSALIRTPFLEKIGSYNSAFVQLQDYEMWLRALLQGNIYVYPEELVSYRRFQNESMLSSTKDDGKVNRVYNERQSVIKNYVSIIPDDLFAGAFYRDFRYEKASTTEEYECEKAFLLYRMMNPLCIDRFIALINDKKTKQILEKQYQFSEVDFYKMNESRIYWDEMQANQQNKLITEYQKMFQEIEETIQVIDAELNQKNAYIMQLETELQKMRRLYAND